MLASGGPAGLHAVEHPLQAGLGFPVMASNVASHATAPQLQQVTEESGLLSP